MSSTQKDLFKKIEKLIKSLIKSLNLNELKEKVRKLIKQEYDDGLLKAEDTFDTNFVRNKDNLNFLTNYVNNNIQAVTDDIGKDIRQVVQRAMLGGGSVEDVKKTIREDFNDKKYLNRFKTIVRTEANRAGNQAQIDSAKSIDIPGVQIMKYLDVTIDDRTSDICLEEQRKYGDKGKAIPLDQDFEVTVKNKTYVGQNPPFHPNCRTVIMFTEA